MMFLFGDIEGEVEGCKQAISGFYPGNVNLLIIDCQYTPEEYRTSKRGWGHSSWDYCLQWMKEGEVERMALTHHEPLRTDQALGEMLAAVRVAMTEQGLDPGKIIMAEEGLEVDV